MSKEKKLFYIQQNSLAKNLSYIQLPLKQAPFLYSTAIYNKIACNLFKPAIEIPKPATELPWVYL
jgi:hypothetical protein